MNTPICDFVKEYIEKKMSRLHMPGHKGMPFLGCEDLDITEISGADSLYEADGIIAESEKNAAELFGSKATFYSAEGSTQCIKAMLYLAKKGSDKRTVLAPRNAHKAFLHACALLDLDVRWLYAEGSQTSLCSCTVSAETVKAELSRGDVLAVYITTPNYLGEIADIASLVDICHSFGVPILADNAHGAYLRFLNKGRHPLECGADMCCDSAHKTLPVLTGGAYLHIGKNAPEKFVKGAKNALSLFGSTSPSYLIMQSLDLCNKYIADGYEEKLADFTCFMEKTFECIDEVYLNEPLKITIDGAKMGYTGGELGEILRKSGFEPEMTDGYYAICMVTPQNSRDEIAKLADLLRNIPRKAPIDKKLVSAPRGEKKMSIREAFMAESETVLAEDSVGRICAEVIAPCPPAIPIAVSGEEISRECAELLKACGIERLEVVK